TVVRDPIRYSTDRDIPDDAVRRAVDDSHVMAARDVQMAVRRIVGDEPSAEDRDIPDDAICRAVNDRDVRAVRDVQMAVRRIVGDSGMPYVRIDEDVRAA